MKIIIAAWIEQILEFDNNIEYLAFVEDLERKEQQFVITSKSKLPEGKVRIRIMKQYNKNYFPKVEECSTSQEKGRDNR